MVSRVDGVSMIAPWIRHSHENFDGSGYPDGLSGDQIPLASRILLVADAFDAMTSDRPYREALSVEAAMEQLNRNTGRQFDPQCVEAFAAYIESTGVVEAELI
jgi:HD-GYP domain-containing protein (c-di-GMP phosphodiesterase class II)